MRMTNSQLTRVKELVEVAEAMSGQLLHIMENQGLDKIPGCKLCIVINPKNTFVKEDIFFGECGTDAGSIRVAKGVYDARFKPTGRKNSAEYEYLFADEELRKRMRRHIVKEKPLPPDGLWIGNDYNDPPLDCYGREVRLDDLPVRGAINS